VQNRACGVTGLGGIRSAWSPPDRYRQHETTHAEDVSLLAVRTYSSSDEEEHEWI